MVLDNSALYLHAWQEWLDRKTIEFNGLYPAISVTAIHVNSGEMVNQALQDLESGTNRYHSYIIPGMNVLGGTSRLADRLMDLSVFTVANVNDIAWQTIGRFYRAHSALYEGKVLTLPLTGDFLTLYYRQDIFTEYGMKVPRTLEEYVFASQALNGTDLNGDGYPHYGSCFPKTGVSARENFLNWITQTLQYRGTSQGSLLDTDTLTPLLENSVVQKAIKLWKQVAGPPELTSMTNEENLLFRMTGRCAMAITGSVAFNLFQNPLFNGTIGTAIMPGSEELWSRESNATVPCNKSFCRHAKEYQDGLVVNHAPADQSLLDGAVNGQVGRSKQLAAYTFLTWLMNDANMLEAVLHRGRTCLWELF